METKTGTIVTLKKENGYGFIQSDDVKEDNVFFHANHVLSPKFEELVVNERVEYLEIESRKGKQAVDVVVM